MHTIQCYCKYEAIPYFIRKAFLKDRDSAVAPAVQHNNHIQWARQPQNPLQRSLTCFAEVNVCNSNRV